MSASNFRRYIYIGLLLFTFPSRFQVSTCHVVSFDDSRNVFPIHSQHFFLIYSSTGSLFVLAHIMLLLMTSNQRILSILFEQLFIHTCIFLRIVVVVLHTSALYSRTILTFVLNILTLMLVDSCV
ncbi:hypothetical protein Smp_135200 [Schistosoma mansoni]|uniref:Secreted peptide n=1 Tax=Schistosoma mansoni TaxID=6183 RepID=G4VQ56_SCHMA|nr:hypothetical protein Smp_135200 [Schistosoma mansoni]|eukprot:XP_018655076.1 hypothetical protein Smp_135200 [Schistosoma mansoni]